MIKTSLSHFRKQIFSPDQPQVAGVSRARAAVKEWQWRGQTEKDETVSRITTHSLNAQLSPRLTPTLLLSYTDRRVYKEER
ncbi:hypothetical protein ACTXT7_001540 [Hymenolepis weldensis]